MVRNPRANTDRNSANRNRLAQRCDTLCSPALRRGDAASDKRSTKAANVAETASEVVLTTEDLSRRFNVSTKTVDRWRSRGLVGTRMRVGNRHRIGFRPADVEQFVADHAQEVQRGARFSQLTEIERAEIVQQARRLARNGSTSGEAIRCVAQGMGRSIDAVRQTLRNHDLENPHDAVFPLAFAPNSDDMKQELYRRLRLGATIDDLTREYSRPRSVVERMVNEARIEALMAEPIDFVDNELFHEDDAESIILGEPPLASTRSRAAKPPAGLPPYLASLYAVPLLTAEQEAWHFRKFNFLKCQAKELRDAMDPNNPAEADLRRLEVLLSEASETKDTLIRSNLRLVVSIAKKNIRPGSDFFEMVSDGNMSLIRAIEKFDFSRGFKLSTYATWAIRRNFARSIPAEHSHHDRFRTGNDQVFHDSRDDGSNEFEQQRVHSQQQEALMKILKKLQDRERDILVCRYGLVRGTEPLTLEQVGARFGVTKERIRQLETRALTKLRSIAEEEKLDIPGI